MKIQHWLQLALAVGLVGLGFFWSYHDNETLNKCSKETTAIIEDIYKERRKGYMFVYSYKIKGVIYRRHESQPSHLRLEDVGPGDSITIQYACDDFDVSRIKSDKNP